MTSTTQIGAYSSMVEDLLTCSRATRQYQSIQSRPQDLQIFHILICLQEAASPCTNPADFPMEGTAETARPGPNCRTLFSPAPWLLDCLTLARNSNA